MNEETQTTTPGTIDVEGAENADKVGLITPDDVYTIELYTEPELLGLYFTVFGGVLVAAALVYLLLHYVGRYRT